MEKMSITPNNSICIVGSTKKRKKEKVNLSGNGIAMPGHQNISNIV